MEGHAKCAPISRLPLITVSNAKHPLKDIPVCQVTFESMVLHFYLFILSLSEAIFIWQPFHLEMNFFNKESRVLHYPVRAFYVDDLNLMAYNLCSGTDSIYKKLQKSVRSNANPWHQE